MKSRLCFFAFVILPLVVVQARAFENSDKLFAYLQDLYNRHDKNLHEFLLTELNQYVMQFPDGEKTAAAQYLIAKVYQEKGDKQKAVAVFLKTIYLYPGSSWQQESANEARKMISTDNAFKDKRAGLLPLVDGVAAGQNPADRYFHYLNVAMALENPDAYAVIVTDAKKFLILFPEDTRQDSVLKTIAELYAKKGDKREAEASYLRLEYCCEDSPLLPYARYNRGVILSKDLGDHKTAIQVLSDLAARHPESEYAAAAILKMGEIKKEKTKDYAGAIADYRKVADSARDSAQAVEALWAIAEINTDRLKNYGEAIAAYQEIVDKHKSNKRAVAAFEKIGDVYKDKLADYNKAAEQYAKIAETFPYYEKAPDLILKAGALCEDKLRDHGRAVGYYNIILEKFPKHKSAGEARKRIEKTRAKTGQP
ncbi:MAG: tetratricopeptide repeat protein [candidate division KSB1 bacterium]|nr:tetratricopeptide repeat protein [candidate division KSB1 bacterium]